MFFEVLARTKNAIKYYKTLQWLNNSGTGVTNIQALVNAQNVLNRQLSVYKAVRAKYLKIKELERRAIELDLVNA